MPFNINHMTPVLFGANMAMRTGMKLREFGCTKVLFVYDQGIKKAGIPDRVIKNVEALGMEVSVYEGVLPDPPDYTIEGPYFLFCLGFSISPNPGRSAMWITDWVAGSELCLTT